MEKGCEMKEEEEKGILASASAAVVTIATRSSVAMK